MVGSMGAVGDIRNNTKSYFSPQKKVISIVLSYLFIN
jgi:hypothetical protein